MKQDLTDRAIRSVIKYTEEIPSSETMEMFIRTSLDILQESIEPLLVDIQKYRGMAHKKEYSERIMGGEVCSGQC